MAKRHDDQGRGLSRVGMPVIWLAGLILAACSAGGPLLSQPADGRAVVQGSARLVRPFATQAAPKTAGDVASYTFGLYDVNAATVAVSKQVTIPSCSFTGVPDGTYKLRGEAFDAGGASITKGGPQLSSDTVAVAGGVATYAAGSPLDVPLPLLDGTGGSVAVTLSAPWLGTTSWVLLASPSGSAVASYATIASAFVASGLPDGTFDAWMADDNGLLATPFRRFGPVTVSGNGGSVSGSFAAVIADTIATKAGSGTAGFSGDSGPATSAELDQPKGLAIDSAGNLYIADANNHCIRKVDALTGTITTVAGIGDAAGGGGDGGPATSANLSSPNGVTLDAIGNLYIADTNRHRIRKVDAGTGNITTLAGSTTGTAGSSDGVGTAAGFSTPTDVAVDASGNLYVADTGNDKVRKIVVATGQVSTLAGTGTPGYAGDGGAAASASLDAPRGVAVDAAGNVYVADSGNQVIRRIDAATGIITTVAGIGVAGYTGDGGAATSARLNTPRGVALDAAGNLYVGDTSNHRVRMVSVVDGRIYTVAGDGTMLYGGDGSAATAAQLNGPHGLAVNASGQVYVVDAANMRVRGF